MPNQVTCPQLADVLNENECLENRAGMASTVYLGLKSELAAALTATENTYSTPAFATGKGLYKVDCKDDANQVQGSSLGYRKGFELTFNFTIDSVNPAAGKLARAINNRDVFIIVEEKDGTSQIMYDPKIKVKFDSGGIKTDTGAKGDDDRSTTFEAKLTGVNYPNLYVTAPTEKGWDSLLASKKPGE